MFLLLQNFDWKAFDQFFIKVYFFWSERMLESQLLKEISERNDSIVRKIYTSFPVVFSGNFCLLNSLLMVDELYGLIAIAWSHIITFRAQILFAKHTLFIKIIDDLQSIFLLWQYWMSSWIYFSISSFDASVTPDA